MVWIGENLRRKGDSIVSDSSLGCGAIEPLLGLISLFCFFLDAVFSAGFVRLARLKGEEHQTLPSLWQTGIHFFWRMCGFTSLMMIAALIGTVLLYILVIRLGSCVTGISVADMRAFITEPSLFLLSLLIFTKPLLYMRAIILCQDCGIREAWKLMGTFRMLSEPQLPALYLLLTILSFASGAILKAALWYSNLLVAAIAVVWNCIWFVTVLETTRIVGGTPTQQSHQPSV